MTDKLSRLVAESQAARLAGLDDAIAAGASRLAEALDATVAQVLRHRTQAAALTDDIAGLTPDDLGIISCMCDRLSPANAALELGITEAEYRTAEARVRRAIAAHNARLRAARGRGSETLRSSPRTA